MAILTGLQPAGRTLLSTRYKGTEVMRWPILRRYDHVQYVVNLL